MAIIELVDYNENMLKETKTTKAKSTRRSRAKKATDAPVANVESTTAEEAKAE